MRRKLAIEVQQVKSNSVGLVLKSVLYRLQSAHAHGMQLQKVGVGGPTILHTRTLSDLHSSVGDPIPFRMIPRGTEPAPASFN